MWLLYSIISLIAASIMQVLIKKCLNNVDPYVSTIYRNLIIFLCSFVLLFIGETKNKIFNISKKDILLLIIVSICTFVTYVFYFLAMKNGNIKNVVSLDKMSLVIVMFLSAIFLKEKISFYDILGTGLMIIGVLFIVHK